MVISHRAMVWIVASVGIFSSVVALQWVGGFFASELSFTPDEGAHYVSGALIFDYLRAGIRQPPLEFALDYYQHYPKIGLGQWPPLFYVLQAGWYVVFGAQPWSLVLLQGVITATTACLLFQSVSVRHGIVLAAISTALFILNPLVRRWTVLANSDMLLALVSLMAIRALMRFINSGRSGDAAAFLMYLVLAVSAKWNGLALLLAPPLAVVLARDFGLFRNRRVWMMLLAAGGTLSIVPLMAVGLGFTGFGHGLESVEGLLTIAARPAQRLPVVRQLFHIVAAGVLGLAAVGAWNLVAPRITVSREARSTVAASTAWIVAVLMFHVVSPITGDDRYLLPCIVGAHLLFAEGAALLRIWLPPWVAGLLIASAAGTLVFVDSPTITLRFGYRDVARSLPTHLDDRPTVVLIASDSAGEGSFIAQRLAYDAGRESFVMRGFTTLATDDWQGESYRLRFTSPDEVRAYLLGVPVNFIVIDKQPQTPSPPHIQLLTDAVLSKPAEFVEQQRFALRLGQSTVTDALVVYRNVASPPASAEHLRSVIPLPRGLER